MLILDTVGHPQPKYQEVVAALDSRGIHFHVELDPSFEEPQLRGAGEPLRGNAIIDNLDAIARAACLR